VKTGRFGRSAPVVSVGTRTALRRAGVAILPGTRTQREARRRAFHARTAQNYAELLGGMKGALMKVGQIMSFVQVASLVPEEYQDLYASALGALQSDAPPMDFATVRGVVEAEFGTPLEDVFDRFSETPIAAASIGQVHAARIGDRELAVKVQYPGVADAIAADLDNTDMLAGLMGMGSKMMPGLSTNIDFRVVAEEIRDRIVEELDYEREARSQEEFRAVFAGHPFIRVPAVDLALTTERVLVQEMVDGRRFQAACESPQELRDQWGEAILRFVYGSIHRDRLFNADPHPGNYLFHEDGSVTFLDFGCVKAFTVEQEQVFRRLVRAVLDGDGAAVVSGLVALGSFPPDDVPDAERLLAWYQPAFASLIEPQPFTYTEEWAASEVARQYDPFNEWKDVSQKFSIAQDMVFLSRITIGLNSVLGKLQTTCHARGLLDELFDDAEPVSDMGRLEAQWMQARHA